jgi:hypothetical protein
MHHDAAAEALGDGRRIALDDQIEVHRLAPEQQVADRAAHHVDARKIREPLQQWPCRRQCLQAIE